MTTEEDGDDYEAEHMEALEGAEWAFVWAALTVAAIGFVALVGAVWRAWPWF